MASNYIDLPLTLSGTPSGAAGGDLGGSYPNPTVVKYTGPNISVPSTLGFTWNGGSPSTAGSILGTLGTGAATFLSTPSLNANFNSGFAFDGTFSSPNTILNLRALGVNSAGGYNSVLNIYTSFDGSQIPTLRLNADGSTNSFGGLILSTAISRPSAASAYRGMLFVTQGGAGVTDTLSVCLKSAADTYSWVSIVTGG